ncbi:MAG TPA: large conductance mechanosensitive channel protein MscL [Kineosporiaceae bacterium]|nr:large conductance mechanosensitive channel protein MscL [Kineosporiaceae bacterium]
MNRFLRDFRVFALSGNVVDLAIGVILGLAFQAVVDSFANDVLLQFIAAVFKVPDFSGLSVGINGTQVFYGKTVAALISFLIIAFTLLTLVRLLIRVGMNFRAQGNRECDYCKSFVPVDASRCMFCTSQLEPVVTD